MVSWETWRQPFGCTTHGPYEASQPSMQCILHVCVCMLVVVWIGLFWQRHGGKVLQKKKWLEVLKETSKKASCVPVVNSKRGDGKGDLSQQKLFQ